MTMTMTMTMPGFTRSTWARRSSSAQLALLHELAKIFGGAHRHMMAAQHELLRERDHRLHITTRADGRENDLHAAS
jgi:hypothetical protein